MDWHGLAVRCKAKQGEVTSSIQRVYCWMHWRKLQQGGARHGAARLGRARQGSAGLGRARQGSAGLGRARQGLAGQGKVDSKHPAITVVGWDGGNSNAARPGLAWRGPAWRGKDKQGKAII